MWPAHRAAHNIQTPRHFSLHNIVFIYILSFTASFKIENITSLFLVFILYKVIIIFSYQTAVLFIYSYRRKIIIIIHENIKKNKIQKTASNTYFRKRLGYAIINVHI